MLAYLSTRLDIASLKSAVLGALGIALAVVLYAVVRFLVGVYAGIMLEVDTEQLAALPEGARIIAANHPSVSDPFLVARLLRTRSYILIAGYIFELAVAGALLRRMGHIPVAEGAGRQAYEQALALLAAGRTVVIFPEGQLSPASGGMLEPRSGAARLALESGAPIVPVGIHLLESRLRRFTLRWREQREESALYLRGPFYITVGEPLYYTGDAQDRPLVHRTAHQVMERIAELAQISRERMQRRCSAAVQGTA